MTRPALPLALHLDDRLFLEDLLRSRKTAERVRVRCQIILLASEGAPNAVIAERLQVTRSMVLEWRKRFGAGGLQELLEESSEGRSSEAQGRLEELQALLATPPAPPATAWTVRALARELQCSPATVQRLLETASLRTRPRRLSSHLDPNWISGVVDLAGFYLHSPYHTVALEVDPTQHAAPQGECWPNPKPGEPAWMLHLHLRSIEGLRRLDGRSTHYSSTFWRFLQGLAPRHTNHRIWCITDTPLPPDCLHQLAFERKELRVTSLEPGTDWLEAMKVSILPALQAHLHHGRCPSIPESILALETFLRKDAQDPLQWCAGV